MNNQTYYSNHLEEFYAENNKLGDDNSIHQLDKTSLRRSEAEYLAELIEMYKPNASLEIGLALGSSTLSIVAKKIELGIKEKHIALDPFQEMHSKNAGIRELDRLGLKDNFIHYPVFSEDYLNKCFDLGKTFDFIFIDGNHTIGQAVTDAFLSDKILNSKGCIAIHDSLMYSTAASVKYLVKEKGYSLIAKKKMGIKTVLKMVKYLPSLGLWYCINVLPRIRISVMALQKN